MQHPEIDAGSPCPWWGKEETTAFMHVPLMTRTEVSHSPGIPASEDSPASCVQASNNGNTSSDLIG